MGNLFFYLKYKKIKKKQVNSKQIKFVTKNWPLAYKNIKKLKTFLETSDFNFFKNYAIFLRNFL